MTPSEALALRHPDRSVDRHDPEVVVGWTHRRMPTGVDLKLQAARSRIALENERVDSFHFLMTDNQALLLAKYLLDATGQSFPAPPRKSTWVSLKRLFRKR
jgi:hypothetical protein